MSLLEVDSLTVEIGGRRLLDGIDLALDRGERWGVIGESGSGKSLTALAILGLLPDAATVTGNVRFDGTELIGRPDRELSRIRGNRISMIFQEPASSLDPLQRVGAHIAEPLRLHRGYSRRAARSAAIELAARVGLPDPEETVRAFPHQLSGGQRQRVCIAAAVATEPELLIADEPTTALDVTVAAEILRLLRQLTDERGTALVFVTHDLAVLAQVARRVAVLGAGRVRETGTLEQVLAAPSDPITRALVTSARELAP
ncbi:MAG: ABC transporter ATP-binding protein [Gordonia sp. (in: high G+C Gram-positive bacteria)]